jgi:hypothetical protein
MDLYKKKYFAFGCECFFNKKMKRSLKKDLWHVFPLKLLGLSLNVTTSGKG